MANKTVVEAQQPGFDLVETFQGASGQILDVAWSPDGKTLAAGSADCRIHLWESATGKKRLSLPGHSDVVFSVAWSSDSQRLASGSADKSIRLWRNLDGGQEWENTDSRDAVSTVAFSPNGETLAAGSWDKGILLVKTQDGATHRLLEGHTSGVNSVTWKRDGSELASGSNDESIRLWDVAKGTPSRFLPAPPVLGVLEKHHRGVNSVAWSPDGKWLASGISDGTIRLWGADSQRDPIILRDFAGVVTCVCFSHDGQFLASKSGHVRIWRCDNWKSVAVLPEPRTAEWFRNIAFHPKEPLLATLGHGDKIVRVWKLAPGSLLNVVTPPLTVTGYDVFLSHNSKDKPAVRVIADQLREEGILPWIDDDALIPGRSSVSGMEEAMKKVKAAVIFCGPHGFGPWHDLEREAFVQIAVERKIPIIPVILPDVTGIPDLPVFLKGRVWVDYRRLESKPFERLVQGIRGTPAS